MYERARPFYNSAIVSSVSEPPVPSLTPPAAFLETARTHGLLTPGQVRELSEWIKRENADLSVLVKKLLRRDWLTSFQVKQLAKNRGADLILGPYVLLELIGEGGMGRVFKARHTRLGRIVALKLIRREKLTKPNTVERFEKEIRATAKLAHPNVVLAYDAGEANGHHFYTMEFIEGPDLTKVVQDNGPLPITTACGYASQTGLALHHAHEQSLVHRDVKPGNILVTAAGRVKLLDLGLAMAFDQPSVDDGRVTKEGFILGTPDFLAPEQARNSSLVDCRADVYALGGTLYFLLTGKVPYETPSATEKLLQHCMAPPPSLLTKRPESPPELDAVIKWMMAKQPEDRPQTPGQAAAALQPFCQPGPFPTSPTPEPLVFDTEPTPRTSTRHSAPKQKKPFPVLAVALGLLALGLFTFIGVLVGRAFFSTEPDPEPEFRNALDMKMIRLPGGSFRMGSPAEEPGRSEDEGPAHEVIIFGPFYISAAEVTVSQYQKLTGHSPSTKASQARQSADLPVDSVTWYEAVEFCKLLSMREAKRRTGWAYRLPTEAEWEYACRAGTSTPFSFGPSLISGKEAVFRPGEGDPPSENGKERVAPILPGKVGETAANPFGLYDLHGNVWEWTADWYGRYPGSEPRTNPTGPDGGDFKVLRGGAWDEPSARCRSAARNKLPPGSKLSTAGLRVVFAPVK